MKILSMKKLNGPGDLRADFSAEFGDPPWIVVRGMKLFARPSGLWPSMPGVKYQGKWEGYVNIINPETLNELARKAQEFYSQLP